MAIYDDVKAVVAEQLHVDNMDDMKMESEIIKDFNADSLDVVELMLALEDKFGIEIPDEAAEKISTIGDIVTYIESNKK